MIQSRMALRMLTATDQLQSTKGKYDFVLPRLNVVADVRDDVLVRLGYGSDIRRPDFNNLSTAFEFDTAGKFGCCIG